jgi:hypothetical protein
VFHRISSAPVLLLLTCTAFSAPRSSPPTPAPQPTEVKVISVPPAQPTEVKIISTPPATPAEVRIVSAPENASERNLVTVTWLLLFANVLLCLVTFGVSWIQSRDLRLRDRRTMVREINRAANNVMITAERLKQLAFEVPPTRNQLHILLGQGGMPPEVKLQAAETLRAQLTALEGMLQTASESALKFSDVESLSDKQLAERLWSLDEQQERLAAMREAINFELNKYETESQTIRQHVGLMAHG